MAALTDTEPIVWRDSGGAEAIETILPGDYDPDSSMLNAIDKVLKSSDAPNYNNVVFECLSKLEHRPGLTMFQNMEAIQNNKLALDTFRHILEVFSNSPPGQRQYQPIIDFLTESCPACSQSSMGVERRIEDFLAPFRDNITALVMGKKPYPMWSPKKSGKHRKFLVGLGMPADTEGKPDMLLHELGKMAKDRRFSRRLGDLFRPGTLQHKFLVNTSGSGKTKLLVEGLCLYWGIYLSARRDALGHGSRDTQTIIDKTIPNAAGFTRELSKLPPEDLRAHLDDNVTIAQHQFKCLLLARLHILRMFLEIIASIPEDKRESDEVYRKRWLELQIRPSLLDGRGEHSDIFHELTSCLIRDFSDLDKIPTLDLEGLIESQLQYLLPKCTPTTSSTKYLYVIVDEVQHPVNQLFDAFRSDPSSSSSIAVNNEPMNRIADTVVLDTVVADAVDADMDSIDTTPIGVTELPAAPAVPTSRCRPVFREMLHAWLSMSGLVIIAAGTGVNSGVLKETMQSAVLKYKKYLPVSETGSFDDGGRADSMQMKYIRHFIPPEVIEKPIFVALIARTIYWLRGRFRFTAGFISELVAAEFNHPHETLNAYILRLTLPPKRPHHTLLDTVRSRDSGFTATDGAEFCGGTTKFAEVSTRDTFTFDKLLDPEHSDKLGTITEIVKRFWFSHNGDLNNLSESEIEFVQWGFARFCPNTTKDTVAMPRIDEPMALLALAQWLNAGWSETIHHRLTKTIGWHSATGENDLEKYLAFCFAGLFSDQSGSRRLNEIFAFRDGAPTWAQQTATLVSFYKNPVGSQKNKTPPEESVVDWWSRPSYSLGTHPSQPTTATLEWLRHATRVPICFPSQLMGPDLLFILRLQDGKRIWVAVQSKYENSSLLSKEKLEEALRSVTPKNYFSSQPKDQKLVFKRLLELPNRHPDVGTYSLLRVVASFPGETALTSGHLRRKPESLPSMPNWSDDIHPLASLDIGYLAKITQNMTPIKFLSGVRNAPEFDLHYLKRLNDESDDHGDGQPSKRHKPAVTPSGIASVSGTHPSSSGRALTVVTSALTSAPGSALSSPLTTPPDSAVPSPTDWKFPAANDEDEDVSMPASVGRETRMDDVDVNMLDY
ncbi:hypothetical protein K438DRAFT_1982996 [Mycena galopus ATCC 62051]|nr:hypothetical protein K438DRAFT_1982996 [Mycena galopus ATCC 62051]